MRYSLKILVTIFAALLVGRAVADDLDPGDDISTSTGGQAVTWEPMIVHFSAASSHGSSSLVTPPTSQPATGSDVIGEANQWFALKKLIKPHSGSFLRDEVVVSAWERQITDGLPNYVIYTSGQVDGENQGKIHSIFAKDHEISLCADFDVLMNITTGEQRDEIFKKYFRITDLVVTAYQVTKDSKDFRAALEDSAPKFAVYKLPIEVSEENRKFFKIQHAFVSRNSMTWNMAQSQMAGQVGVYEFQMRVTVEGRVSEKDDVETKTIEGAIRIAVVNDTQFEVTKISGGSVRKPGEKDLVKKGKIVGTTQVGQ